MINKGIITENQLDGWVRGNARKAQSTVVDLVWRLICVSSPNPKDRRIPLGDSIGQHGPDCVLDIELSYEPFVPDGTSYWEIGTGVGARDKATSDYNYLVENIDEGERHQATFVFVTPLSGRKDWEYSWKEEAQASWLKTRRERHDWKDVRIIDGTKLIDWLHHFPGVEVWLANEMGHNVSNLQTIEQRWDELRTIGDPPPLIPDVFLANRDEACSKIKDVLSGTLMQLKIDTLFPEQVTDFVIACVANMETEYNVLGSCLIISDSDTLESITSFHDQHILIADFNLEEKDAYGAKILNKARRAGHAMIYGGRPDGIPNPYHVPIPNPTSEQIQNALEKAGYNDERARMLSQRSKGNISYLLKLLQGLSLMPEWAQGTDAADLTIAEFLGSWNENTEADCNVVENLSGNRYGEWIKKIRDATFQSNTPLTQRNGVWKFVARYEGWYALGPKLFDDDLDKFIEETVKVLREHDPKFDLPPENRFAANIYGKNTSHSKVLREGLAESLALLGSHAGALTSCSVGKAEDTAVLAVREILTDADWVLWASLDSLLPLLAEAAPREFLHAVENALISDPCPFDTLFEQEGGGITGDSFRTGTYISGLLWALETLAWSPEYIINVVRLLGELAARDPGGNWANRPSNSLTTILLPWLPQTCASIEKRKIAVETLISEHKDVAWNLLISLLPREHDVSSGSRKPIWREIIPEDWSKFITNQNYWEQIILYTDLTLSIAKNDMEKLIDLIDHFDHLPLFAQEQLLEFIGSLNNELLTETEMFQLWDKLVNLAREHRYFADADWSMTPEQLDKLSPIIKQMEPKSLSLRHQRLFSERSFELFEECKNFEEQDKNLEKARQQAIDEISKIGGIEAILELTNEVDMPWDVGIAYGIIAKTDVDGDILPDLMDSNNRSFKIFSGGFIRGRFQKQGWEWVDQINNQNWSCSQIGQLFAYLPFNSETWGRVSKYLKEDESPYWSRANATPYKEEKNLEYGINQLIQYHRPLVAIRCLDGMTHRKQPYNPNLAIKALIAAVNSEENHGSFDDYVIKKMIIALEKDSATKADDILRIEWMYLPIFYYDEKDSPELLEQKLADDPKFFCKMIRLLYRSNKASDSEEPSTEKNEILVTNAYHLFQMWRIPPGSQRDGTYDGEALKVWLDAVKKECEETGHFEIAMITIGQVLIHSPPDPDGLWIHHSIAKELNDIGAEKMRIGFNTGFINSRGVHLSTSGKEEMTLAENYRKKAEEVEAYQYHRLANSLRELAADYDREAKIEAQETIFDY